jgi:excisionase family DNA binding protein
MAMVSDILTAREAADYLRINLRTLYRLIAARHIPYRKIGDSYRLKDRHRQRERGKD